MHFRVQFTSARVRSQPFACAASPSSSPSAMASAGAILKPSILTKQHMAALEKDGHLDPGWLLPGPETIPKPPSRHIVSTAAFAISGLRLPESEFLEHVLMQCGIELVNLTPNSILILSVFQHLCEGFLGILPTPSLFLHYYTLCRTPGDVNRVFGAVFFQLRDAVQGFPSVNSKNDRSWSKRWFYLSQPDESNLHYTGKPVTQSINAPAPVIQKEEEGYIAMITTLSGRRLSAQAIVKDYLENRVSPLRRRERPFYQISGRHDITRESHMTVPTQKIDKKMRDIFGKQHASDWYHGCELPRNVLARSKEEKIELTEEAAILPELEEEDGRRKASGQGTSSRCLDSVVILKGSSVSPQGRKRTRPESADLQGRKRWKLIKLAEKTARREDEPEEEEKLLVRKPRSPASSSPMAAERMAGVPDAVAEAGSKEPEGAAADTAVVTVEAVAVHLAAQAGTAADVASGASDETRTATTQLPAPEDMPATGEMPTALAGPPSRPATPTPASPAADTAAVTVEAVAVDSAAQGGTAADVAQVCGPPSRPATPTLASPAAATDPGSSAMNTQVWQGHELSGDDRGKDLARFFDLAMTSVHSLHSQVVERCKAEVAFERERAEKAEGELEIANERARNAEALAAASQEAMEQARALAAASQEATERARALAAASQEAMERARADARDARGKLAEALQEVEKGRCTIKELKGMMQEFAKVAKVAEAKCVQFLHADLLGN